MSDDEIKNDELLKGLTSSRGETLAWIAVDRLRQLKRNPQYQTEAQMEALKRSIDKDGFLAPVLVRPIDDSEYEIVSGNHRVTAAISIGLDAIPCVIVDMEDDTAKRIAINLNTIHGEPQIEQLAPFLADMSDESLSMIHFEKSVIDQIEEFDRDMAERIKSLEVPRSIDTDSLLTSIKQCICPACGRQHIAASLGSTTD